MALKIDILANTRQLQGEMKKAGASVEDISSALDDVARDGDKSTEKLESSFKELARASEKTGDDVKRNIGKGLQEAGSEAKQSGREAAASFSGEFSDVGDFLQETVANGLGGFGPLGLAAGIAGAAGLGLITAEITKQQEEAARLKEYFADAYQSAAEEGRAYLDTATILKQAQDLLFNPDRAGEYIRALEDSKRIGVDINTLALARAGDQESLNIVIAAAGDAYDKVKEKAEKQGSTAIRLSQDERRELEGIKSEYEGIGALQDENAQRAVNAQGIRNTLSEQETANVDKVRGAVDQLLGKRNEFNGMSPIKVPVDYSDITNADRALSNLQRRALSGVQVAVNNTGRQLLQ